jgi:segregation and condensation protein A
MNNWKLEQPRQEITDRLAAEALIVDVDGFEGPLDLLLSLSRSQKVDLRSISVNKAKYLRLELAADYLVMAAWLTYLKSRLLLPPDPSDEAPSAEKMALHLAFQLERLQAMRDAAARLMMRDLRGRDVFARGAPEEVLASRKVIYNATLLELMRSYARIRTRDDFRPFSMNRNDIYTMQKALERMRAMIGYAGTWSDLETWLPEGWGTNPHRRRSSISAHFAAILEMTKAGELELRQGDIFASIHIKKRDHR